MGSTFLLIMLFRTKRENVSSLAPHVLIYLNYRTGLRDAPPLTVPSLDPPGHLESSAPGLLHAIKFNKVMQRIR